MLELIETQSGIFTISLPYKRTAPFPIYQEIGWAFQSWVDAPMETNTMIHLQNNLGESTLGLLMPQWEGQLGQVSLERTQEEELLRLFLPGKDAVPCKLELYQADVLAATETILLFPGDNLWHPTWDSPIWNVPQTRLRISLQGEDGGWYGKQLLLTE